LGPGHDESPPGAAYRGRVLVGGQVDPSGGAAARARRAARGPEPQEAGLRVDGLSVRFGGLVALDDVSLAVSHGEVVGVIGPNGAGKTTLFNVICGFVRAEKGTVSWRGRSLNGVRPHDLIGEGIARTLQGVGLFDGLTALQNVMAGAERRRRAGLASALLGLPRADRDERALRAAALQALDALGVADVASRLPSTLPYPVQKRVALARALVAKPELILLDEPAAGLGGDDLKDLGEAIRALGGDMAVLLVEHHMDLVMGVCDRVVVLDFGRRIAEGTPSQVQADPRVLEAYLGVEVDAPR
jgi:branched-chain amino acid transport system ATP-binding protein